MLHRDRLLKFLSTLAYHEDQVTGRRNAEAPMSYRNLLAMAAPFILANAAVPTLGLVDTAAIRQRGPHRSRAELKKIRPFLGTATEAL